MRGSNLGLNIRIRPWIHRRTGLDVTLKAKVLFFIFYFALFAYKSGRKMKLSLIETRLEYSVIPAVLTSSQIR